MGWADRRSRKLVEMMKGLRWANRVRVWLAFADSPNPPAKVRGLAGADWVLTGSVARARRRR